MYVNTGRWMSLFFYLEPFGFLSRICTARITFSPCCFIDWYRETPFVQSKCKKTEHKNVCKVITNSTEGFDCDFYHLQCFIYWGVVSKILDWACIRTDKQRVGLQLKHREDRYERIYVFFFIMIFTPLHSKSFCLAI